MSRTAPTPQASTAPARNARLFFAGILLLLIGAFNVIEGLAALFKEAVFVDAGSGILIFNFTSWGWIHLIIGALQILISLGLMAGRSWATKAAVAVVALNVLGQLLFFTVYPLWSTLIIALDVFVLWCLIVHGLESAAREAR
ncbi:DUF7144 family membrane protein [Streptomyces sp. NBC_01217]|uniref:DUF7144 family membrane protein n=1 Tax=Streptomyces sp. NBC_01217 TaxID=2903779 RepID=UPI002E1219DF|nr:hypothetical protein OG507_28280 [Streptomyces sp. NBC_01217]